ncbi:MAG: hypothetical protein USCGTAYLOR_01652 [Chromatiales bacterium USCg_Taylor]|nr:MAG: hypothetical protein USCGTAYLOR_01652 [Chromatiales bacterium USCg_Taylor]
MRPPSYPCLVAASSSLHINPHRFFRADNAKTGYWINEYNWNTDTSIDPTSVVDVSHGETATQA